VKDEAYLGSVGKVGNKVTTKNKGRHQTGEKLSFHPKKTYKTSSFLVFVDIFETAKKAWKECYGQDQDLYSTFNNNGKFFLSIENPINHCIIHKLRT
jgi:hypothetical protein